MLADYKLYSARCDKCQRHALVINQTAHKLLSISASYPFMTWSMDVIGSLEKSRDKIYYYLMVLIDYLTKWQEAEML